MPVAIEDQELSLESALCFTPPLPPTNCAPRDIIATTGMSIERVRRSIASISDLYNVPLAVVEGFVDGQRSSIEANGQAHDLLRAICEFSRPWSPNFEAMRATSHGEDRPPFVPLLDSLHCHELEMTLALLHARPELGELRSITSSLQSVEFGEFAFRLALLDSIVQKTFLSDSCESTAVRNETLQGLFDMTSRVVACIQQTNEQAAAQLAIPAQSGSVQKGFGVSIEEAIEEIRSCSIVSDNDKKVLILTLLGEKPCGSLAAEEFGPEVKQLLEKLPLHFSRRRGPIACQPVQCFSAGISLNTAIWLDEFSFSMDCEMLESHLKCQEAAREGRSDDVETGCLYGYPPTAVAAYAQQDESLMLSTDEMKRLLSRRGLDNTHIFFVMSRADWEQEILSVAHWERVIAQHAPELVKTRKA